MCDTPPNSLYVSESVDKNEKDVSKSLDELATIAIETSSNDSSSMQSSNSCPVVSERTTRNSLKMLGTPVLSMSTRSRDNPDFVAKHKYFMAQVQAANLGIDVPATRQEPAIKRKRDSVNSPQPTAKKKKISKSDNSINMDFQNDNCCWECHREGQFICCEMCPRVFHLKCVDMEKEPDDDWACHECHSIMLAENVENRSRAMQLISVDQLCVLLKFALTRLTASPALSPFCNPVDTTEFPTYRDVIIHPLDLETLEKNIKKKLYGSTEAFFADARWIYHNSVIFNGANSKVTSLAKTLLKILRQELSEIETCPDCYQNAHLKPDSWFTEACRLAHPLVWAKLKGFPYWPAKAVKWKEGNVDVRFFGRHDRSWVQLKDCCLYSEQMPTTLKSRNRTLETCMVEVKKHIQSLEERFGEFKYAPQRVVYNPHDTEQIKLLLPYYKGPTILKIKPSLRIPSRQSQSGTDDDTSSVTSTDSCSIYSRKRGLLESLHLSETQSNQDDSEPKTDDGMEEVESDKGDVDSDSRSLNKTSEVQTNQTDIDKDTTAVVENSDENCAGPEVINAQESLCKDELNINKNEESDEMDVEQTAIDSKPATEGNLEPGSEEVPDACKDAGGIDVHASEVVSDTNMLDVEIPDNSIVKSSPISIKQAVEVNSMLLDDELGIEKSPKKSIPLVVDTKKANTSLERIARNNSTDGQAEVNESVLKLECINALLASQTTDTEDTSAITNAASNQPMLNTSQNHCNKDALSDSDLGLFSPAKNDGSITKSDSARSSIDEDSFQGFFSSDPDKEKAESCRNLLKKYRIKSFLLKEDDSDMEHQSDASIGENVNHESPAPATSSIEKEYQRSSSVREDHRPTTVIKAIFTDAENRPAISVSSVSEKEEQSAIHIPSTSDQEKQQAISTSPVKKVAEDNNQTTTSQSRANEDVPAISKCSSNESGNVTIITNSPKAKVLLQNSSITVAKVSSSSTVVTNSQPDLPMELYPTLKIAKVTSLSDVTASPLVDTIEDSESDSVVEEVEEDPLMICESPQPSPLDIESYATKMFHNVTISKSAGLSKKSRIADQRPSRSGSSDAEMAVSTQKNVSDTLSVAAKLVENISNNVAVKRVDNRTLEHTSGNDRITISVADNSIPKNERAAPRSVKEARMGIKSSSQVKKQLSALGSSVSVSKASSSKTDTKIKVPLGVDTTRLSPSISILPVAGASPTTEKQKVRCLSTVSVPSAGITTTTVTTTSSVKSSSPLISGADRTTPSSNVPGSPSLPPPPLSHPISSATGSIRGILGAHLPHLQGFQNGPRVPMPASNMRMMVPSPAMMLASRMTGPVLRPSPPEAGPLSAELGKHSMKLAEMMRSSLEEVIGGLVGVGSPEARLAALQLENERCNWRHQQEMADVRHNADVMLVEMRASLEAEKQRCVEEARKQGEMKMAELRRNFEVQVNEKISEVRKQCELTKQRSVEETKKKQWCANCCKEALLFCCWNTSYCDYPCQQNHWPQHMSVCGQNSEQGPGPVVSGDVDMEVTNGNMSGQSSGLSTPVHSNLGSQLIEEDPLSLLSSEERRRRKRKEVNVPKMLNILHKDDIMPSRKKPRQNSPRRILPQPVQPPLKQSSTVKPMTSIPRNSELINSNIIIQPKPWYIVRK